MHMQATDAQVVNIMLHADVCTVPVEPPMTDYACRRRADWIAVAQ
jgi:hypothetical protein